MNSRRVTVACLLPGWAALGGTPGMAAPRHLPELVGDLTLRRYARGFPGAQGPTLLVLWIKTLPDVGAK